MVLETSMDDLKYYIFSLVSCFVNQDCHNPFSIAVVFCQKELGSSNIIAFHHDAIFPA